MRLIFGRGKVCAIIRKEGDVVVPHSECDVGNLDRVREITLHRKPSIIINTAANTSLERCEDNKKTAFDTNTLGPLNLLTAAAEVGAKLVHMHLPIFQSSYGCL